MLRAILCSTGLCVTGLCWVAAAAQTPTLTFQFENPQSQQPRYEVTLHPDGSGRFHGDGGGPPPQNTSDIPSGPLDRDIHISPVTTQRIFAAARSKKWFDSNCDSGSKVAFTGKKQLSYSGPEGHGTCEYNYSHDPQIQWVTTEMQGVAATLEEGRRLDLQHEHGRLGLDAELEALAEMVKNGQTAELSNIAPTLTAIVQDEAVLERAQRRARQLLQVGEATEAEQPKR